MSNYCCADYHKRYLFRNSFYCYDIDTFKYNSNNKTFSIDIIYDIQPLKSKWTKENKSLNDIEFIILNIEYDTLKKSYKTKYRGYVTGHWYKEGVTLLFNDSKMYYTNNDKIIPYYKKISKEFKQYANLGLYNHYINFPKDIQEIYNASKNNSIYQIEDLHKSIDYEIND